MLIAAKKSSPLVIGIGKGDEYYIASDATPIVEYTRNVVYLNDEEIAVMKKGRSSSFKYKEPRNNAIYTRIRNAIRSHRKRWL